MRRHLLAQAVLAVATKWTLVPAVLPFAGLDTVTPGNADVVAKKARTLACWNQGMLLHLCIVFSAGDDALGPLKLNKSEVYGGHAAAPWLFKNRESPR